MDRASPILTLIDCGEPISQPPLVDETVASALRARLGERAADEVLEDAIFEITEGLFAIEAALAAGDGERRVRVARRMGADAASIGLMALAIAARDLAEAVGGAGVAEAHARLVAVAEDSLIAAATSTEIA